MMVLSQSIQSISNAPYVLSPGREDQINQSIDGTDNIKSPKMIGTKFGG